MRKIIIKSIYLVIIFIAALFIISSVVNQGNTDMTMEMGPASFPVIQMYVDADEVNELHGFIDPMQSSYQRDSLTPLAKDRKVSLHVNKYGQTVKSLSFEVRSVDGKRLVENTVLKNYTEEEESIRADFTIKDLIEEETEYMLVILLEMESGNVIRYYTRIIQSENYHANEKINFVMDFHAKTFEKENAGELTKYLESNSEGDNTTYSKVTIHSSYNQVTWGDLEIEKETQPKLTIKELAEQTGSFEIQYIVSLKEGKRVNLYRVKEFYRVRYTTDRIYLLDYERTMKQIIDENADIFANNKIQLGITKMEDIELKESDGGSIFAFTDGSRLYCYNITEKKLAKLFSFYNGNYKDERETWLKHEIKILNVDEAGNVQFIVTGYMNRGRREGALGISVYNYSGPMNTVEEMAFIPCDTSFELLKADLDQLAYLNKTGSFFFIKGDSIYSAGLENRNGELIVSGLKEGNYEVSESNRMVVWQNGVDVYNSDKLVLMNLNTQKRTEINAGTDEKIAPLGFMGEDLIYGLAKQEDIMQDYMGNTIFPMYKVLIQSESNEILDTYQEDNTYIIESEIIGNQINFQRVKKDVESGSYIEIENYQIVNIKPVSEKNNILEEVVTEKFEKVVQIAAKGGGEEEAVKRLTPKEVLFEGGREILLQNEDMQPEHYYVYGKNGIEGIFTDEDNAVNLAYDLSGIVVNDEGTHVWMRGNRSIKNQIMAIQGSEVTEEKNSLAVCLDTILSYEGIMRNSEYLLEGGKTAIEILESNMENVRILDLTGCSLDAVLYYVNMDIPVLASLQDGTAVLIIGFNELNIVLMDPTTGTVYKKGMNDSKIMLEESGNKFVTYIRTE